MRDQSKSERLSDTAFKLIKGAIINGELKPGDILMEQDMIERFNLGRTPIREALQKLSVVGLVKSLPHKGSIVAVMSKSDVKDVYELRCNLDSLAAKLASLRATDDEINELEALLYSSDFNESNRVYYDELMHKCIYKCAHNNELYKILNDLYEKSVCMFSIGGLEREPLENMKAELERIIIAIKNHDSDAAEAAALCHVQSRNWF